MDEFAAKGYKNASTNNIVKKAGVSKGILFYYFKNKKELFLFLVDYALDFIKKEHIDHLDEEEPDFIERYKKAAQVKLTAYTKNPHVFNFLATVYLNNEAELDKNSRDKLNSYYLESRAKLYKNIDTSLFREDIDQKLIYRIITWALEGYQQELMAGLKGKDMTKINFDPYWEDFYRFLKVLKKLNYKAEEE